MPEPGKQLIGFEPNGGFYGLAAYVIKIIDSISWLCASASLAMEHRHSRPRIGFLERYEVRHFPTAVVAEHHGCRRPNQSFLGSFKD